MTREQYQQMREAEVENQKRKADMRRKDASLSAQEKDREEYQYQSLCQQQADWNQAGFWTDNETRAYNINYKPQ